MTTSPGRKGLIEKKEVLDFIRANQVEVKEVVKGDGPKPLYGNEVKPGHVDQRRANDYSITKEGDNT